MKKLDAIRKGYALLGEPDHFLLRVAEAAEALVAATDEGEDTMHEYLSLESLVEEEV